MELAERLGSTEVEFPFGNLPETDEAKTWLMELDFVDVLEGSIEDLEELARTAPTREAAAWLRGLIHARKMMRDLAAWPPAQPDAQAALTEPLDAPAPPAPLTLRPRSKMPGL